jgi:hypothetical protein
MDENFKLYGLYDQMRAHKVILAFKGVVSQDLLSRLASSLKRRTSKDDPNIGKKVFGIFIELSQNVSLHSAEKSFSNSEDKSIGVGLILASEAEDHFLVSSCNAINNDEVESILQRCQYINSLDAEGLKDYYKKQRREPQRDNKPGANIGLIDMVRRSNNHITADVNPHPSDANQSLITISLRLNK